MENKNPIIWIVGLSGSGKTTVAQSLIKLLSDMKIECECFDGDTIRSETNNTDFSKEGRIEHNKKIVDKLLLNKNNKVSIIATISPFQVIRSYSRSQLNNYYEVYVCTPLEVCKFRDPKGLYRRAEKGLIDNFTGVSQEFEAPEDFDIKVDTSRISPLECAQLILGDMKKKELVR